MPKANKTKAKRTAGKKANLPYTPEDFWKLYRAARDTDDTLAHMILLSMYTGCTIGELAHMKLTSVSHDRFTVEDSKTYIGLRDIPIHKDLQQVVERLKQLALTDI